MEMDERIKRMALATWDVIGGDCLTALAEVGNRKLMKKDEVIESVCDAGYMKTYGNDLEAYEYWSNLPTYEAKMEAVEPAFLHEYYGW